MNKSKDNAIILFDGVCNLCNNSVLFIIKRDKNNYFKFASIQSEFGQNFIHKYQLPEHKLDTLFLFEDHKILTKSTAVFKIAKHLNGFSKYLYYCIYIPKFLRDAIYDIVAKNRYQWFGKYNKCMTPTKEIKNKFL